MYSPCGNNAHHAHCVEDHCVAHFHMALCGDALQDTAAMENTCQSKLLETWPVEGVPTDFPAGTVSVEQSFPEGSHVVEWSHIGGVHHRTVSSRSDATLGGEECKDGVVA